MARDRNSTRKRVTSPSAAVALETMNIVNGGTVLFDSHNEDGSVG
jgi:hypothetical protein